METFTINISGYTNPRELIQKHLPIVSQLVKNYWFANRQKLAISDFKCEEVGQYSWLVQFTIPNENCSYDLVPSIVTAVVNASPDYEIYYFIPFNHVCMAKSALYESWILDTADKIGFEVVETVPSFDYLFEDREHSLIIVATKLFLLNGIGLRNATRTKDMPLRKFRLSKLENGLDWWFPQLQSQAGV